jgi:polyphosphate kinase 2 (PPK2 family)
VEFNVFFFKQNIGNRGWVQVVSHEITRATEIDIITIIKYWLVVSTPMKNMKVSWDDYSQYMEKMFETTNQNIIKYQLYKSC